MATPKWESVHCVKMRERVDESSCVDMPLASKHRFGLRIEVAIDAQTYVNVAMVVKHEH